MKLVLYNLPLSYYYCYIHSHIEGFVVKLPTLPS